ncbi:MAG: serine hydrolase [Candidatus Saccharimonadales bacterium]
MHVNSRNKAQFFYVKYVLIVLCVALLFIVARSVFAANASAPNEPAPSVLSAVAIGQEPSQEVQPKAPKREVNTSNLQNALKLITEKYPYNTSVSVVDLNSGNLIQTGDSYPFIAASTTKLLSSMLYLNNVETGQASLDDEIGGKTARAQLELAVNKSDNEAWTQINNYLNRESLAVYAKKQGLTSYDATKNTITSNDMALLIAKFYKRELLNDEHTKLLLSWMQNTSEERFIPPAIPQGVALYHKAGYLPERVHDVAIVDNGSAPFVIVVYSKSFTDSYDFGAGQQLFKQVTEQTVKTFQ